MPGASPLRDGPESRWPLGMTSNKRSGRGDYQLIGGTLSTIGGGYLEMQLNNVAWYQLGLPKG